LKPENLFLVSRVDDENFKLGDFGMAVRLDSTGILHGVRGSPGYTAPEVLLHRQYGKSS
jgi:calcium/calmodulin-dependent protein kinase I